MEIVTFRSSTPAAAVGVSKTSADGDGDECCNEKAAAVISHISAAEIPHLLAPIEQGLVQDQSMLHFRSSGGELIISAKDLRQVAGERANRAENSYDTIIQASLEPVSLEPSTFATSKNYTYISSKAYASIRHESYAYIAVKALHRRLCSFGAKVMAMIIAFLFIIGAVVAMGVFFRREQYMSISPSEKPIPATQRSGVEIPPIATAGARNVFNTFTNFSISAKLLGETVLFPNVTGAFQMMPPLAYIDSKSGQMVLSFTRNRNATATDTTIDKATVFTTENGIGFANRSAAYYFNYYSPYSLYLQCFDVTENPNTVAYCCIDRASRGNGSFIHCMGPNNKGKPEMNYLPYNGRMIMTDWIKENERMILAYLIISDRVILVLHPNRYIKVPYSEKIAQIASSSDTLNSQVFISTATKFKQSELTFAILLIVHIDWPPSYYICSYKLNIEKYEVIALDCTVLPTLYNLIRNLTSTKDGMELPEAFVDVATISTSKETVYLIHVPAEFPEYLGSDSYGYKDIAAFSSSGSFIGIDSLLYEFPVIRKFMDVINNAFAGNMYYCVSTMRIGPEIAEIDRPDDPDDKYTMLSAMNVYSYSVKVCVKEEGKCFELDI